MPQVFAHYTQVIIRLSQPKVLEKNLIQGVVIILARMNENLVKLLVRLLNNCRHFYNFGACAHDGHQFQLSHTTYRL